jgi:hypothetical protein
MRFNRLLDGLYYYNSCALCDGHMTIKNDGMSASSAKNKTGFSLIFNLEQIDKLIINPITEEIDIDYYKYNVEAQDKYIMGSEGSYDYIKSIPVSNTHYNYNDCFNVSVICKNCCDFEYSIDITIDLYYRKVLTTRLSDICYCIKDNGLVYYINNNYYNNQTILTSSNDKRLIEVPLMNLNKENIKHSFERLQKLIIFS